MIEEQDSPEHQERKEKIMGLFANLLKKGLTITDISKVIPKPGYYTLINYSDGELPKSKPELVDSIITQLEELDKLEITELLEKITNVYSNASNKQTQKIGDPPVTFLTGKPLVLIDLLSEAAPQAYNGVSVTMGYPFEMDDTFVMVGEPIDSKKFKDGECVVRSYAPGWTGFEFVIKRIKKKNCTWGYHYYVWDIYNQAYYVSLYEDKDREGYYKLVHDDPIKYPEKKLHESEILVVFKVPTKLLLD